MLTLQRYGLTASATYGQIDNLTMTYTGNQMKTVNDAAADIALNTSMDFKNYSNVATEYTYNRNGAMSQDLNKGISSISYNSLNLPRMVDIKNKTTEGRNEYTYSASGVKLKAVQRWNPNYSTAPVIGSTINTAALTQSQTTDYVGNIIYENNTLKRILVDGGYNESGNYYFYIQDHLGNNRIVTNAAASVVQSTQYYPFGSSFADASGTSTQPYKYNGKELDARNGLNMYDYSARWKDDFRFTTVDPLAEMYYSWSPYAYVKNNPINAIDPDGKLVIFINGFVPFKNQGGSAKYWDGFDKRVMQHLNDRNAMYINGAVTLNGSGDGLLNYANNRMPSKRYGAGYAYGTVKAQGIFNSLRAGETIKIITHSMGAAYAKGFVQSLIEYCIKNGIDTSLIEFEADFAPFQPTKQKAVDGVMTYQFSNDHDMVANNRFLGSPKGDIEGANVTHDDNENKGHSITDFIDQLKKLPAGKYKIENGELVPY